MWPLLLTASSRLVVPPLSTLDTSCVTNRLCAPPPSPRFSAGYSNAGGSLPENWRKLARVVDLVALCESLTHDQLPDKVVAELLELVCATVENRDPRL